jgi:putative membrane protein
MPACPGLHWIYEANPAGSEAIAPEGPLKRKDIEMKTRHLTFITVILLALSNPLLALAQQTQQPTGPHPWDWPHPWHMGGWGFGWMFPLFMLFMIIICIAIVFFLGHRSGSGHHHLGPWQMMDRGRSWGDPTYSALQILNERFAKGEIQKQEYEEKKAIILSSRQH